MLLNSENTTAALVIALSGAIAAKVANGFGPVSLKRVVAGALSNPVPRETTGGRGRVSGRRIAV